MASAGFLTDLLRFINMQSTCSRRGGGVRGVKTIHNQKILCRVDLVVYCLILRGHFNSNILAVAVRL